MPSRFIAKHLIRALDSHITSEKYPTRHLEYFFAFMLLGWSVNVLIDPGCMSGPAFKFATALLPTRLYAAVGLATALAGIVALVRNGHWKRSPTLRMFCSGLRMNWWILMFGFYLQAIMHGAPNFPMFLAFPVVILFEALCLLRCAEDAKVAYLPQRMVSSVLGAVENVKRGR